MRVYGYTESKKLVGIDLSNEKIVSAGIDPWRLDLFDAAPITLTIDNRPLNFRKLGDVSFWYPKDGKSFIGLDDGTRAIAFAWHSEDATMELSTRPFAEHFCEYLQSLKVDRNGHIVEDLVTCGRAWPSCALLLGAAGVQFDPDVEALESTTYVGNMFDELQAVVELGPEINWVFTRLGKFGVTVFGEALWKAMADRKIGSVDFFIDDWKGLESLPGVVHVDRGRCQFKQDDCIYNVHSNHERLSMPERFRADSESVIYSASELYSCRANEVRGSRISFFDVAQGQERSLRHPAFILEGTRRLPKPKGRRF